MCKTKLKLKVHGLVNFLKILSATYFSRQVQCCQGALFRHLAGLRSHQKQFIFLGSMLPDSQNIVRQFLNVSVTYLEHIIEFDAL